MAIGRITRDQLFLRMVDDIARRSTCNRKQVGALVVRDGRPIGMGYAGSPSGTPHCLDVGCLIGPDGGCIRTQHAEANCVSWAAREGIALHGATMYCSLTPCTSCAKLLVNTGIDRFVAIEEYRLTAGSDILLAAQIPIDIFPRRRV